jgi:prevent-host-death family protein
MVARITAQEFNRDVSAAKRAAAAGPVFITRRGRPTHVLLTIEDFTAGIVEKSLYEALRPPARDGWDEAMAFDLPPRDELPRAADFG